jgi:hypothetical protein
MVKRSNTLRAIAQGVAFLGVAESAEPKLKRFYPVACRDALREIWGVEGVDDVKRRMSPRERDEMFADPLPLWFPERPLIAFNFALWEGPAARDRETYSRWLRRMTDLSFGLVKRLLLSVASPRKIIESAHEIWKADHTHGVMEGRCEADDRGTIVLRDSLFMQTPQARAGMAEMLRYIVELGGAKGAIEKHALVPPGVLQVKLRWA